jgi:hypothetical protein
MSIILAFKGYLIKRKRIAIFVRCERQGDDELGAMYYAVAPDPNLAPVKLDELLHDCQAQS